MNQSPMSKDDIKKNLIAYMRHIHSGGNRGWCLMAIGVEGIDHIDEALKEMAEDGSLETFKEYGQTHYTLPAGDPCWRLLGDRTTQRQVAVRSLPPQYLADRK